MVHVSYGATREIEVVMVVLGVKRWKRVVY